MNSLSRIYAEDLTATLPQITSFTVTDGYIYNMPSVEQSTFACKFKDVTFEQYSEVLADGSYNMLGVVRITVDTPREVVDGSVTENVADYPTDGLRILTGMYEGTASEVKATVADICEKFPLYK